MFLFLFFFFDFGKLLVRIKTSLDDQTSTEITEMEWKLLFSNGRSISFTRNQVVINSGEIGTKFYRVLEGTFQYQLNIALLPPKPILTLEAGDIFGMESFFNHLVSLSPSSLVCKSDTGKVEAVEATFVVRLLRVEPNMATKLYRLLALTAAIHLRQIESGQQKPNQARVLKKFFGVCYV